MWTEGYFRAFISYSGEDGGYDLALEAKKNLERWGISAFVDSCDIQKGSPWRTSLVEALTSTHIVLGLLTPEFRNSDWADQEIGFAVARRIPAFPINYGVQSYGFFGEYQEMDGKGDWVKELPPILLARPDCHEAYLSAYIATMRDVESFDEGNRLAELLPHIQAATPEQLEAMKEAYNGNHQLQGSYGFNGEKQFTFGPGLEYHIKRLSEAPAEDAEQGEQP